jgi:hypothetical protein
MCSVIILRRPGHDWPVVVAANRDEMADRDWRPPARHWPEQPTVVAGLDRIGRGTWLGINDAGVVCGILNRLNTLGPAAGLSSRGGLPLLCLAEPTAARAAAALGAIDPASFRPFNLFVVDRLGGFWARAAVGDGAARAAGRIEVAPLPDGLSMLTAYDLNDPHSPRIRRYLPRFRAAAVPDPDTGDWTAWRALLASREADPDAGPGGAMTVVTETGFGTVSSSMIALPAEATGGRRIVWLFAAGRPGEAEFGAIC